MNRKEKRWKYINEFRRYNDKQHQLYFEGKWININTGLRNDLDKTRL